MNNSEKNKIQSLVLDWCKQGEGYSQNEFAKKTDISSAYISKVVNGQWSDLHPSPMVWQKIARFFNYEQHLDTVNYLNIQGACKTAQNEKSCIGVDGYSGAGKTYALKRYADKNPNVYHIICRDSMSIRDFLEELAVKVGIENPRVTRYALEKAIVQ